MKFTATIYGEAQHDFDENVPDVEIEFDDVKEIQQNTHFFIVIKNNGEQFATRLHTVKKYSLTNQ